MFYFKYQLKLEFIPYVEEETLAFTSNIESKLASFGDDQIQILRKVLKKKIEQIDKFYLTHYEDYRAQLALRIKDIIHQFWTRNSERLSIKQKKQLRIDEKQEEAFCSPENKDKNPHKKSINSSRKKELASPKVSRFELLAQTKTKSIGIYPEKPQEKGKNMKTESSREKASPMRSPTSRGLKRDEKNTLSKGGLQNKEKRGVEKNKDKKMSKEEYIKYLKSKKY